jgi:hypothetical protein
MCPVSRIHVIGSMVEYFKLLVVCRDELKHGGA